MVQQDQEQSKPRLASITARVASARMAVMLVLALGVVVLAAGAGLFTGRFLRPTDGPSTGDTDPRPARQAEALFADWPTAEFYVLLSGQEYGYLLPCGCSRPQKGGLERRYNFLQGLKKRGPVVAADLGDIPPLSAPLALPPIQSLLKYKKSMLALQKMDYAAVGIGESERRLPLTRGLDEIWYGDIHSPRVVAANLANSDEFPDEVGTWKIAEVAGTRLKVAMTSFVAASVAKLDNGDKVGKFNTDPKMLSESLKIKEAKEADLRILLFQGTLEEAKACATLHPNQFQVILCRTNDDDASDKPEAEVGGAMILSLGHKCKSVGVVGVFAGKQPGSFGLRYQRAEMTENYETPKGQEASNPILALMEEYTSELKKEDYLHKYGQVPHPVQLAFPEAQYVGSARCKTCHPAAYDVWAGSHHAHAYDHLVKATRPAQRQYDAECVVCHVTGFGQTTGFTDDKKTPLLKDVGCESCHGPGSAHIKNKNNLKVREVMNPWKAAANETEPAKQLRMGQVARFCVKCHDMDNDVHWNFDKKWAQIKHMTPKD